MACTQAIYLHYQRGKIKKYDMGEDEWRNEMQTKVLLRNMKRTQRELVAQAYGKKSFAS